MLSASFGLAGNRIWAASACIPPLTEMPCTSSLQTVPSASVLRQPQTAICEWIPSLKPAARQVQQQSIRDSGSYPKMQSSQNSVGKMTSHSLDLLRNALPSIEEAKEIAKKIGYPVLVKASAGGGGRGIRRVDSEEQLEEQLHVAQEEAKKFFGDDTVYLEKLIVGPHHVEVQIIADEYGNTVALGERDCSMQRRNQKVLEESPSPLMTPELRDAMQKAAVAAAKACGYCNAGTIEFLVDHERNFYFMEMNTRIQVEHPVTEWVTGIDLVQTQLRIAQGEPLPFTQEDITLRGHAIECRINAENPDCNFRPSPGTIQALHLPGGMGVRIDSAIYQGYTIPPYYDSMIAKLIVHAPTRKEAIQKMRWALSEFLVDGVETNIDFQLRLLKTEAFEQGTYDNAFLMHWLEDSKHKQS